MLRFSKESTADILNGFECGIQIMDDFIHCELSSFLREHPQYDLYVAKEEQLGIVAIYVLGSGFFFDHDGEFADIPDGKPWGSVNELFEIETGTRYPTIEIEYLAVRKDLREQGYGTEVLSEIERIAKEQNRFFLTVQAFHSRDYNAIPFYESQGFFALQEFTEDSDTLRMARRV